MFHIGHYCIPNKVVLAPMAGVSDLPFRKLCKQLGAGMVVSEMVTSDSRLWKTTKSQTRLAHDQEIEPRVVQIAGNDPQQMADAAALNVQLGAQIIDINMGCPAKKVCKKLAGSALLQDEKLVASILNEVVDAVSVPVTLKIRTGSSPQQRNGTTIAKIAEDSGISALTVHGRTRACKFNGSAEYDTIAKIVQSTSLPVIANGDIGTPHEAKQVLEYTEADAIMIGRAAQGRPWIFREVNHYLATGEVLDNPPASEIQEILLGHLRSLHNFYGEYMGVRIARKHVGWYLKTLADSQQFRAGFNQLECAKAQQDSIQLYFETLIQEEEIAA